MTTVPKISELEKMSNGELGMLAMFLLGIDVKRRFNKNTYFKYKKALKGKGFDISHQVKANRIPETESLKASLMQYR